MKILVVGDEQRFEECQSKFGSHEYSWVAERFEGESFMDQQDLIIDFTIEDDPHEFDIYASRSVVVFLNTTKITLSEILHLCVDEIRCTPVGFCGLPTLLNRSVLEISLRSERDEKKIKQVCQSLSTDYLLVDDRVGMVTARVICMIINEAFYTVQEGTASREDIDLAMKLGTNYPWGPFEWCDRIGLRHVYEVLEALYEDTKDERYKICPLLKKQYLQLR